MAVALVLLLAAVGTDVVGTDVVGTDVVETDVVGTDADLPLHAHSSFFFNSPDRPLVRFSPGDVRNFTALLLSDDHNTLYVGARDAVLSLDVSGGDDITLKRKVSWRPTDGDVDVCRSKGKNATTDCGNFVGVLQRLNASHVYACGSFAFSPRDAFLDADTLAMTPPPAARARCPFSPWQRSAALVAGRDAAFSPPSDGELFTAAMADFKGVSPLIARHFSKAGRPDVSQESSPILLDEADFVGSALDAAQRKVLFFFGEAAKEFNVRDELQVARVASVCQDDVGGVQVLQKKWTSLVKTTLRCRPPFAVLRDVFALPPEDRDPAHTLFYAVFGSQWSLRPESAVCAFQLASLRAAFAGPYRRFDADTHQWSPLAAKSSYFGQCGLEGASHGKLEEVKRTFLTAGHVAPEQGGPLLVSAHHRYSRVAAMSVPAADGRRHRLLFLLTESGILHKVFLSPGGPRLVEEIAVLERGQRATALALSASKGVAFVGSWGAVTAVPVARCSAHRTCGRCLLAGDPLCGWSPSRKLCAHLDQEQEGPKNKDAEQQEHMVQLLEGGDVAQECRGGGGAPPVKNVAVRVNEVVKLWCSKPWRSCTLKWASSRFRDLPPRLFIQSDDGSLNFLAGADTLGEYRCQAQEAGYTEAVARYDVTASAPPRSLRPGAGVQQDGAVWAGSSSPPPLCERRGYQGRLAGLGLVLAVCGCFLMSAAILACVVHRKSAAKRQGGVSEPRVELRQLPDKQHRTDTPA